MTEALIDQIIDKELAEEGGYVCDPDDPGGATNHGVTIAMLRFLKLDLNGDGVIDCEDVKLLSPDQARGIFKSYYFHTPAIDTLPAALQPVLVDTAINSGPGRAIILLQDLLDEVGLSAPDLQLPHIIGDGELGPITRKAAVTTLAAMSGYLVNAYCVDREAYMRRLAKRNPALDKYIVTRAGGIGGWITRARSFKVAV